MCIRDRKITRQQILPGNDLCLRMEPVGFPDHGIRQLGRAHVLSWCIDQVSDQALCRMQGPDFVIHVRVQHE